MSVNGGKVGTPTAWLCEPLVRLWRSWGVAGEAQSKGEPEPAGTDAAAGESSDVVSQMLDQGRYAFLMRPQIARTLGERQLRTADSLLTAAMIPIPAGPVRVEGRNWRAEPMDDREAVAEQVIEVEAYWLDRYPVTNRQFLEFVKNGGYKQPNFWDPSIRGAIAEFRDATGEPGPRYWRHGRYLDGFDHHPVVGISWYEASAYACWVGKRLPSDPEWVRAAAAPVPTSDGRLCQRKFPWGDSFDATHANLWEANIGTTVPIHEYPSGVSPQGVHQLIGNVWEWTSTDYGAWDVGGRPEADMPMKALRGGAFDTYFPHQASWQFQSGDTLLARRRNVGFRCALSGCDVLSLPHRSESSAT